MAGIKSRSDLKTFTDAQLPSGTGAITAAQHRDLVYSVADSMATIGEVEHRVINMSTNTPPSSPSAGDKYVIGSTPTGAWVGYARQIAIWDTSISPSDWFIFAPENGQPIYNIADSTGYRWDDTNSPTEWSAVSGGGGGGGTGVSWGSPTTYNTTGGSSIDIDIDGDDVLIIIKNLTPSTSASITWQVSPDGGTTMRNGASDYRLFFARYEVFTDSVAGASSIQVGEAGSGKQEGFLKITGAKSAGPTFFESWTLDTAANRHNMRHGWVNAYDEAHDVLRLSLSAGTFSTVDIDVYKR